VKCEKCSEEWNIADLGSRQIKFCPFCGTEYTEKEPTEFVSIVDCFKYLKKKHSHAVFFESKKIITYVSDYMPNLVVEKRILRVALEAGVYKMIIDDAGKLIPLNIEKAKHILVNEYGLSDKWANESVGWFIDALNDAEKSTTSITKSKQNQRSQLPLKNCDNSNNKRMQAAGEMVGRDSKGYYKYTGKIDSNGVPHGKGVITYSSGVVYEGNFANGLLSGKGKWTGAHGVFEGFFEKGKQVEGPGILVDRFGNKYEGTFRKGLRMHGVMTVTKSGKSKVIREKYDNNHFIRRINDNC